MCCCEEGATCTCMCLVIQQAPRAGGWEGAKTAQPRCRWKTVSSGYGSKSYCPTTPMSHSSPKPCGVWRVRRPLPSANLF